jgi:hypothetical protein
MISMAASERFSGIARDVPFYSRCALIILTAVTSLCFPG